MWEFVFGCVRVAARCCTDCRLALPALGGAGSPPTRDVQGSKVCASWRCSSPGFQLLVYVPSNLGDQSLIFNRRWGSRHVYIAIFSVFGSSTPLLYLFCWFGSALTLLVQVDLGFWHCPLSSHTQCQIPIQHIRKGESQYLEKVFDLYIYGWSCQTNHSRF